MMTFFASKMAPKRSKLLTTHSHSHSSSSLSSSSSQSSSSTAALVKQLSPVYQALDAKEYKSAHKWMTSLLNKSPHQPLFIVIHALIITRDDGAKHKNNECCYERRRRVIGLLQRAHRIALQSTAALDSHLLASMALVLTAWRRSAAPLYSQAVQQRGDQVEPLVLAALFFTESTALLHEKAQKTAMRCYTLTKAESCLYWSAVHQLELVRSTGSNRMLQLATMMIKRAHAAKGNEVEMESEDCRLLSALLCRQGEYREAEALLTSAAGSLYRRENLRDYQWDLCCVLGKSKQREKQSKLLRDMLVEHHCDWTHFCAWLDCEFILALADCEDSNGVQSVSNERVDEWMLFIRKLQENIDPFYVAYTLRNSCLAVVELVYRLALRHSTVPQKSAQIISDVDCGSRCVESLLNYYKRVGYKACFFSDVRKYVQALDTTHRNKLLHGMREYAGEVPADWPNTDLSVTNRSTWTRNVSLWLSYHQCLVFSGTTTDMSVETLCEHALLFYRLYLCSLLITMAPASPTERGLGDDYLLLFVSLMRELHMKTNNFEYEMCGLFLLEHVLKSDSPHNFDILLHAMRLHCSPALANVERAHKIFNLLDVKQIQLESLSHLLLYDLFRYGSFALAGELIAKLLAMHDEWEREQLNVVQSAFELKRWLRLGEIFELNRRLRDSAGKRSAQVLQQLLTPLLVPSYDLSSVASALQETDNLRFYDQYNIEERSIFDESLHPMSSDDKLCVNSEHNIVTCFDPPSSSLHSWLHYPTMFHMPIDTVPAPYFVSSVNEDGQSLIASTVLKFSIALNTIHSRLLIHLLQRNPISIRTELRSLQTMLEKAKLLDLSEPSPISTTVQASPSFDVLCWRLYFLVAETAACVMDAVTSSRSMFDTASHAPAENGDTVNVDESVADVSKNHLFRFSSLHRQMLLLAELCSDVSKHWSIYRRTGIKVDVISLFVQGHPNTENKSLDNNTLRDISFYLTYSYTLLNICCQIWVDDLPSKKSIARKEKAIAATPNNGQFSETFTMIKQLHLSLAQLIASHKTNGQQMITLLNAVATAQLPFSMNLPLWEQCQSLQQQALLVSRASVYNRVKGDLGGTAQSIMLQLSVNRKDQCDMLVKIVNKFVNSLGNHPAPQNNSS